MEQTTTGTLGPGVHPGGPKIVAATAQKKCYIAGQISGLDEEEYMKNFGVAEQEVSAMGMQPVNPCCLPHEHDKSWLSYMRHDLAELLQCDAVYMLSNWGKSKGATIEWSLAVRLGLQIIYQDKN